MKELLSIICGQAIFYYLVACFCAATFNITQMAEPIRGVIAFVYVFSVVVCLIALGESKNKRT
jgi:hypothetical protein